MGPRDEGVADQLEVVIGAEVHVIKYTKWLRGHGVVDVSAALVAGVWPTHLRKSISTTVACDEASRTDPDLALRCHAG